MRELLFVVSTEFSHTCLWGCVTRLDKVADPEGSLLLCSHSGLGSLVSCDCEPVLECLTSRDLQDHWFRPAFYSLWLEQEQSGVSWDLGLKASIPCPIYTLINLAGGNQLCCLPKHMCHMHPPVSQSQTLALKQMELLVLLLSFEPWTKPHQCQFFSVWIQWELCLWLQWK